MRHQPFTDLERERMQRAAADRDRDAEFAVAHPEYASSAGQAIRPVSAAQIRVDAVRSGIAALLAQCTKQQVAGLHRIHDNAPWKGLGNCPENKLDDTYELLRRTVAGNAAKASGNA